MVEQLISLSTLTFLPVLSDIDLIKVKDLMRIFNNSVALEVRIKLTNCDQVFVCPGLVLTLTLASADEGHLATGNELLVIRKLRKVRRAFMML